MSWVDVSEEDMKDRVKWKCKTRVVDLKQLKEKKKMFKIALILKNVYTEK